MGFWATYPHYWKLYTEWKRCKCRSFNSRLGQLKGPINIPCIQNFIVFSQKGFLFRFYSRCTAYIVIHDARTFTIDLSCKGAASWRKRLGARLPPLGCRVRVSVPPCGFRGGRNGVWVGVPRGFSRFPLPKISFHHFLHTNLIHFRFISPALVMVRQAWSAGTLAIHASYPSTLPCVGHELRIFIYLARM